MDFKDCNKVSKFLLHVHEQKKTSTGKVLMKVSKSGKKKDDGTYEKSMFLSVLLNENTKWTPAEYTKKNILVNGTFSTGEYEDKNGNKQLTFTIFADEVSEYVKES